MFSIKSINISAVMRVHFRTKKHEHRLKVNNADEAVRKAQRRRTRLNTVSLKLTEQCYNVNHFDNFFLLFLVISFLVLIQSFSNLQISMSSQDEKQFKKIFKQAIDMPLKLFSMTEFCDHTVEYTMVLL